jgi:hypothetical protein
LAITTGCCVMNMTHNPSYGVAKAEGPADKGSRLTAHHTYSQQQHISRPGVGQHEQIV